MIGEFMPATAEIEALLGKKAACVDGKPVQEQMVRREQVMVGRDCFL
jgi:hypothetical protein